jgi:hypothetical protein
MLQPSQIPAPPEAPAPPGLPGTPGGARTTVGFGQPPATASGPFVSVPRNASELRALRALRSELSDQLTSASNRRSELVRQLERLEPEAREGVRQRIELLDQRILRLESEISRTGELAALARGNLSATGSESRSDGPRFPLPAGRMTSPASAIVYNLAVLMPVALATARLLGRRATAPRPQARASTEDSQRLVRLEQAVDTIAVEVERISEGQRFVAQLMSDNVSASRMLDRVPVAGGAER